MLTQWHTLWWGACGVRVGGKGHGAHYHCVCSRFDRGAKVQKVVQVYIALSVFVFDTGNMALLESTTKNSVLL